MFRGVARRSSPLTAISSKRDENINDVLPLIALALGRESHIYRVYNNYALRKSNTESLRGVGALLSSVRPSLTIKPASWNGKPNSADLFFFTALPIERAPKLCLYR